MDWIVMGLAVVFGVGSLALFAVVPVGSTTLVPMGFGPAGALAWNAMLSLAFFTQHSGMIREGFRRRTEGVIAERYQRAVYSVASGVVLAGVVIFWQTVGGVLWRLEDGWTWAARGARLTAVALFVWGGIALRTVDLIGLGAIHGKSMEPAGFTVRGPYRWVRHPWYFAVLLLIWSGQVVTRDRLLFNLLWTAWILVGT
jgi:protein-S-isoprenylcysteine O-methyltransferase Ste14